MSDLREVNAEAGDYIQDDPAAWDAFLTAIRRYYGDIGPLRERFGEAGDEIAAGAMLSYLADEHGVFLCREPVDAPQPPQNAPHGPVRPGTPNDTPTRLSAAPDGAEPATGDRG